MADEGSKVIIEAIGTRKGIGKIQFGEIAGYQGDCAEFDFDTGAKLIASTPNAWAIAKAKRQSRKQA